MYDWFNMSKARYQMGLTMDQFVCHCRTVEVDPVKYKLHTHVLILRLYSFMKFMVISSRREGA